MQKLHFTNHDFDEWDGDTKGMTLVHVFDMVFDVGFCVLANADDLAGEYLRKQRKS